jgi:hypothetical protein
MKLMKGLLAAIYIITTCGGPLRASENYNAVDSQTEKICSTLVKPVLYVVEKGDHLADIIRTFGFKPLYGKRSRVTQVSNMNEINDPNLIFPGQEVYLPFKCEEDTAKYVLIDRELDRQIHSKYLVKVKTRILKEGQRETMMLLPNGSSVAFGEFELPNPNQDNRSHHRIALNFLDSLMSKGPRKPSSIDEDKGLGLVGAPEKNIDLRKAVFSPHSTLSVGLIYGFSRIDSVDLEDNASALLLSRPTTGFALGWQLNWTPRLSSSFNFSSRQVEMRRASVGALSDGKHSISGMGLDVHYQWTDKFKSILGVNYDEKLFVRPIQSGTAALEAYQHPSLDLLFEREMARAGTLSLDLLLGYRQMLKTSTENATMYDSGEYLMGARFRQQLEKMQIELKINYLKGQQSSSLTEQTNTGIEAQFGVKMEVGK